MGNFSLQFAVAQLEMSITVLGNTLFYFVISWLFATDWIHACFSSDINTFLHSHANVNSLFLSGRPPRPLNKSAWRSPDRLMVPNFQNQAAGGTNTLLVFWSENLMFLMTISTISNHASDSLNLDLFNVGGRGAMRYLLLKTGSYILDVSVQFH